MKKRVTFELGLASMPRPDGGVRIWSTTMRGLHLSGDNTKGMWDIVPSTAAYLLARNWPPMPPLRNEPE